MVVDENWEQLRSLQSSLLNCWSIWISMSDIGSCYLTMYYKQGCDSIASPHVEVDDLV